MKPPGWNTPSRGQRSASSLATHNSFTHFTNFVQTILQSPSKPGHTIYLTASFRHFFGKKMAEREGFEPSVILLVKSRLKRCFIPPFERKFLKF